ncbi:hypothetical protein HPG69_002505, partial [Diceros bicornis minor]
TPGARGSHSPAAAAAAPSQRAEPGARGAWGRGRPEGTGAGHGASCGACAIAGAPAARAPALRGARPGVRSCPARGCGTGFQPAGTLRPAASETCPRIGCRSRVKCNSLSDWLDSGTAWRQPPWCMTAYRVGKIGCLVGQMCSGDSRWAGIRRKGFASSTATASARVAASDQGVLCSLVSFSEWVRSWKLQEEVGEQKPHPAQRKTVPVHCSAQQQN